VAPLTRIPLDGGGSVLERSSWVAGPRRAMALTAGTKQCSRIGLSTPRSTARPPSSCSGSTSRTGSIAADTAHSDPSTPW
jgi:hypothetical protein